VLVAEQATSVVIAMRLPQTAVNADLESNNEQAPNRPTPPAVGAATRGY
jgi:hypothetical protein